MKVECASMALFIAALSLLGIGRGQAQSIDLVPPGAGVSVAASLSNAVTNGGPRISFATNVYDFGKVTASDTVKHTFVFTNTGDQMLVISNVMPGCSSCTVAGKWDRQVAPGKTGAIPVEFRPTAFEGPVAKSVVVICNDPTRFTTKLQIKGTVWVPIEVKPKAVILNISADHQTNVQRVVRIINREEQPLKLSEPECTNRVFQVELKTIRPEQEFELNVRVVPPGFFGTFQAPIRINTSSKLAPEISINAVAIVPPPVLVMPQQVALPPKPLAAAASYKVFIRNSGSSSNLVVSEPTLNLEGVGIQLEESQPGRMFVVTLSFPAGFEIKPDQKAELRLACNRPQFPVIRVPVVAYRGFAGTASAPRAMAPAPPSPAPPVSPPRPQ